MLRGEEKSKGWGGWWFRMGFAPDTPLTTTRTLIFTNVLSNGQLTPPADPRTPVFTAQAGDDVVFRVLKPGGNQRNHVFAVHGHIWEELPYTHNPGDPLEASLGSIRLGSNPLSPWEGSRMGHGPSNHFDVLLKNGAGGKFGVPGDYLYRDFASFLFDGGLWGILRVTPGGPGSP